MSGEDDFRLIYINNYYDGQGNMQYCELAIRLTKLQKEKNTPKRNVGVQG
jgi:hypothetical protein